MCEHMHMGQELASLKIAYMWTCKYSPADNSSQKLHVYKYVDIHYVTMLGSIYSCENVHMW